MILNIFYLTNIELIRYNIHLTVLVKHILKSSSSLKVFLIYESSILVAMSFGRGLFKFVNKKLFLRLSIIHEHET